MDIKLSRADLRNRRQDNERGYEFKYGELDWIKLVLRASRMALWCRDCGYDSFLLLPLLLLLLALLHGCKYFLQLEESESKRRNLLLYGTFYSIPQMETLLGSATLWEEVV